MRVRVCVCVNAVGGSLAELLDEAGEWDNQPPSAVYSLEYIYYSLFIDKLHHNATADASNKDSFRYTFIHEGGVWTLFFALN